MRPRRSLAGLSMIILFVAATVFASGSALAYPSKAARDAKRLADAGQAAEQSMQGLVDHVRQMLGNYQALRDGNVRDPESAYKRLARELRDARGKLVASDRSVDEVSQKAEAYFAGWESELEGYRSDDLRQKSGERLASMRERYATLVDSLREASDAFIPLFDSLDDQLLFLGRDLSPEAIAAVDPDAEALHREAGDVFDRVETLMAKAEGVEAVGSEALAD